MKRGEERGEKKKKKWCCFSLKMPARKTEVFAPPGALLASIKQQERRAVTSSLTLFISLGKTLCCTRTSEAKINVPLGPKKFISLYVISARHTDSHHTATSIYRLFSTEEKNATKNKNKLSCEIFYAANYTYPLPPTPDPFFFSPLHTVRTITSKTHVDVKQARTENLRLVSERNRLAVATAAVSNRI